MKYLFALLLVLGGCTIRPGLTAAKQPSFSGSSQNSGVLSIQPGGIVVDANTRNRYNYLISKYGASYSPPITASDVGVHAVGDGTYLIDKEHAEAFAVMATLERSGR